MEKSNLVGNRERETRRNIRERRETSCSHGRQPIRRDLRGLSGDSSSGTTSGGATVWTPACYACAVRGKCSQEKWGLGIASLRG